MNPIIVFLLVVGTSIADKQYYEGKIAAPHECKVETVIAPGGGYASQHVVDDGKGCVVPEGTFGSEGE